ncbi:aminotransferase class IV [Candidatus Pacebacteria bacterium]|nr:aminotransferase class IV [Candidatus Paceibacterota bacterium]
MQFNYFSHNGEVKPISEATVSLLDVGYQYGFGVYETLRVIDAKPQFLSEHTERLLTSAHHITLEHTLTEAAIQDFVTKLIDTLEQGTYNLKLLLIGGATAAEADVYMFASNPLFPDKKLYRDGVHTITQKGERLFPQAKTLNMLQSYLSYKAAKEAGAYDALMVNRDGYVTEGTRTNFFTITGKTIFTPPSNEILDGVTRRHVLVVAAEAGFTVEEVSITPEQIQEYDGAFLTSTSTKIMPIKSIDEFSYSQMSSELQALQRAFDTYLESVRI